MPIDICDPSVSRSSGEIPLADYDRIIDVKQKHQQIADFLQAHQYDAVILQSPHNFSWMTSGGDNSRAGSSETTASLFITPDARLVATSNVDSARLFEHEIPGLGFQLKERPWHEPCIGLLEDLCRGRTVASDTGILRTFDISAQLHNMRIPLSSLECERMRDLGKKLAHAVEATARNFQYGQTEAEIAGQISHRLIKHRIIPERIQIRAIKKNPIYPHWTFSNEKVESAVIISAVGRLHGLCVGVSRTVSFGEPETPILGAHHRAVLMQATGMFFSKPEWEVFEIWKRLQRIYEKFGCENEWQLADQGHIIGYQTSEIPIVPKSEFRVTPRMPIHWHPSIGPATVGDTILVGEEGFELLTPMEEWPRLNVEVKGVVFTRPDILRRSKPIPSPSTLSDSHILH
ncbi:hypothetical protein MNBD_PLANCTO02-2631 [hydrothermal vent metagenome]|uniref:Peptidase M24 domain-containing protein n=1 Tax=hydrothermal vent metagenome TaxID=652676 RepID=A0A3B1DUA3_9ZZZZ